MMMIIGKIRCGCLYSFSISARVYGLVPLIVCVFEPNYELMIDARPRETKQFSIPISTHISDMMDAVYWTEQ